MKYLIFFGLVWITFGCKPKIDYTDAEFSAATDKGILSNSEIDEASGLAASGKTNGYLWTHNDSGDLPRIFSITTSGQSASTVNISGVVNDDWEDIARADINGVSTLFVGDIGDNFNSKATRIIYTFPEPTPERSGTFTLESTQKITFQYPDGRWDAECLMIDQETKDIYIITKQDNTARIYTLPSPQAKTGIITAKFVMNISVGTVTAGDISFDNQEVIIKNYLNVYYWKRKKGERIPDVFKREPKVLPYFPEPQGEAMAFAKDNRGYFTTSEKANNLLPRLYFYERK